MHRLPRLTLVFLVSIAPLGCHSSMAPPKRASQAVANPSAAQQQFQASNAGIAFMYPAGWKATRGSDTQEKFDSPAPAKVDMTLDVPKLPMHIPGLIPIDSVRDGYVNDIKKKVPDAQATNLPDPTVPDARQHRVKLTGHLNGATVIIEGVQLVHGDQVYILTVNCDEKSYSAAKAALDLALSTLRWTK